MSTCQRATTSSTITTKRVGWLVGRSGPLRVRRAAASARPYVNGRNKQQLRGATRIAAQSARLTQERGQNTHNTYESTSTDRLIAARQKVTYHARDRSRAQLGFLLWKDDRRKRRRG